MSTSVTLESGQQLFAWDGVFAFEHGGVLENPRIGYECWGAEGAPLVLVLGGISAHAHVAAHDGNSRPGWWDEMVGEGRAIDPREFRILGIDYAGGPDLSSGPQDAAEFPLVTTLDQARLIALLLEHLQVRAYALVGASYGGMVGLQIATLVSRPLDRLVVISAAHESHPFANALRAVQRAILRLGLEHGAEHDAVVTARALAFVGYRTAEEFCERFGPGLREQSGRWASAVEQYLFARGSSFARRFAARSYLALCTSIDQHRVDPSRVAVPTTLVGIDSDLLVRIEQVRDLARRLPQLLRLCELSSRFGHDAFLKEVPALAPIVRAALVEGAEA